MNNMNSLREIKDRIDSLNTIGKNPYKRILMEKEKQNLSYDYLAEQLGEYIPADTLKKQLTKGKYIDPTLVKQLYGILGIQDELDNNEAVAIYHYTENRPSDAGRPSNMDKVKRQNLYNEAQKRKSAPDKGEYSIDELLLNWAEHGDESEYQEIKYLEEEHLKEIDFLKRVLILYREFPQELEELLSDFVFEDADFEKLNHIEISIYEQ
ncbi:MAG: hypothetical protein ACI4R5_00830 [Acetatifactor sp.]